MTVDRCICHGVTLTELKGLADRFKRTDPQCATSEVMLRHQLTMETNCGGSCGLCDPYIKLMLRTGETEIPLLTPAEWDRLANDENESRAG
ncbi:MAG: hypothetical protein AAFP26_03580 [Planctomycetota bacterium]